jgi:hypothetical protein
VVSIFYGTEIDIWAGFGPVGTKKLHKIKVKKIKKIFKK